MFDAKLYTDHRPLYPPELFTPLLRTLRARCAADLIRVADLGCGAGQSAESLLACDHRLRMVLLDPDPKMLDAARVRFGADPRIESFVGAGAEKTGLSDRGLDGVIIGSAIHWMAIEETAGETARITRAGGSLLVFEYQFPRSSRLIELDEWIRRQFNLLWKAPGQRPRGSFKDLVQPLRNHESWDLVDSRRLPMRAEMGPADLAGHLFSQSRYLHHERSLEPDEVAGYRADVLGEISRLFDGRATDIFEFRLQYVLFNKSDHG